MAKFVKGTTFADGSTVSASDLSDLVSAAAISGVDRGDVDSTTVSLITYTQAAPPGPTREEVWMDTDQGDLKIFRPREATLGWVACAPIYARAKSAAGVSVSSGDVVRPFGVGSTSDDRQEIIIQLARRTSIGAEIGIAAEDFSAQSEGLIIVGGGCKVNVTGTVNAGDLLVISTTNGTAKAADVTAVDDDFLGGSATFAIALKDASAGQVYAWLRK